MAPARALALPRAARAASGSAAFFLVAFYAVVAVGLGNVTELYQPVPHWNPLDWNVGYLLQAIEDVVPGGQTWDVFVRTLVYVVVAVLLSLAIGYPVAYYVVAPRRPLARARCSSCSSLPFWISLPDADVRVDEPARHRRLRGAGA